MRPPIAIGPCTLPEDESILGSLDHFNRAAGTACSRNEVGMQGCKACLLAYVAVGALQQTVVEGWCGRCGAGQNMTCFGGSARGEREENDACPCTKYVLKNIRSSPDVTLIGEHIRVV